EFFTGCFQLGTDQEWLAGTDDVFGQAVTDGTGALGQDLSVLYFELEVNFVAFLKRDIEIAGVKDLPEFNLNGAKDLVLVEVRTDCLPNLSEEFVLLCAALGVVHDDVVFQRQTDLKREADQQPEIGRADHATFSVWKQDDAEIVFASLEADSSYVANVLGGHGSFELLITTARTRGQRFWHVCDVAKSDESAPAISQLGEIFASAIVFESREEFRVEALLHGRQNPAPSVCDVDDRSPRGQRVDQPIENGLHAGHEVFSGQHASRIDAKRGERQSIFLHSISFVLEHHHDHGDAEKHLRDWAKRKVLRVTEQLNEGIAELSEAHQHSPQCKSHCEQLERERVLSMSVKVVVTGTI